VRHIRTRAQFALKKVNIEHASEAEKINHFREVRMLEQVQHPQIIRLF
jgi:hypothetical protein